MVSEYTMSLIAISSYSYFIFPIEPIAIADSTCNCMNYELQHSTMSRHWGESQCDGKVT